ncbi:MAG: hypothetical protein GXP62_14020 [Oligoflexia bacterium]|nr:hypothetical protein [Oligoflexia bacterium]
MTIQAPQAIPHPEDLLISTDFAPAVSDTPPKGDARSRLRDLSPRLAARARARDLSPATLIGVATLQACLQGLVACAMGGAEGSLQAAAGAIDDDIDPDVLAALGQDFQLGELGADPAHRVAAILVIATLRDNPALASLAPLWAEPSPDMAARRAAAVQRALRRVGGMRVDGLDVTLVDVLRAPAAAGRTLGEQLRFVAHRLAPALPQGLHQAALLASDLLAEEQTTRIGGTGPVQAPRLGLGPGAGRSAGGPGGAVQDVVSPRAAFSDDRAWMPDVVMIAKQTLVWLDQLSKAHGHAITRLDQVPDSELDLLVSRGFNCLWLIGLWERGRASQRIKQAAGNPQAEASAYALYDYVIADRLGGEDAWLDLSRRAGQRGLRLASDMVPNHTGIDGRWVIEHPEWFVQLNEPPYPSYRFTGPDLCDHPDVSVFLEDGYADRSDAAVVFKRVDQRSGEVRYLYHGNDGTHMPWNDTDQLDYLNPEVREAVIGTILDVARRFPVIRFDAAMTLARRHIQRLWHPVPGSAGAVPSRAEHGVSAQDFAASMPREFWREVVQRVAAEAPDTLLLAEAFWMMEGYFVRTLGMHRVYNSAFMHMLRDENISGFKDLIREVLAYSPGILERFVHFVNNPDEDTAVAQFGKGDKYFGVTTVMATLPGLPMFGHGQVEGFEEKYGMEYARAYREEQPDLGFVKHHDAVIFPLLRQRHLFSGVADFALFDLLRGNGTVDDAVLAYSNRDGDRRSLVVYNGRQQATAGWLKVSAPVNVAEIDAEPELETRSLCVALGLNASAERVGPAIVYAMRRQSDGLWFLRTGPELASRGLYIELQGYQAQVFLEWRELHGDAWRSLASKLKGAGVSDLDAALKPATRPQP